MSALPKAVGVGFKPQHFADVMADPKGLGFIEVHAENYMAHGVAMRAQLAELKSHMPVSLHGVGLSLGGADKPDGAHLERLRALIDWLKPAQFSEHLAWSGQPGLFANDLPPFCWFIIGLLR